MLTRQGQMVAESLGAGSGDGIDISATPRLPGQVNFGLPGQHQREPMKDVALLAGHIGEGGTVPAHKGIAPAAHQRGGDFRLVGRPDTAIGKGFRESLHGQLVQNRQPEGVVIPFFAQLVREHYRGVELGIGEMFGMFKTFYGAVQPVDAVE